MELSWIVKYYALSPDAARTLSEELIGYGLRSTQAGEYHALSCVSSHVDVEWAIDEALTSLSKTKPNFSLAGYGIMNSFSYRDGARDVLNQQGASFQNVRTLF